MVAMLIVLTCLLITALIGSTAMYLGNLLDKYIWSYYKSAGDEPADK